MRYVFLAAMLVLISGTAHAATNGVSADYSQGVMLLGSPAGAANCKAATTGAIRYNSANPGLQYCDGTNWQAVGGMTLIATQTASGAATIQFSGANWSSNYNTLFLNCEGLIESNNTGLAFNLCVAEGAGPTWETGGNGYSETQNYFSDTGGGGSLGGTAGNCLGAFANSTTRPKSIKVYIDNVGSSSVYKLIRYTTYEGESTTAYFGQSSGYYNADKSPITGFEFMVTSGNIASGTCSLYGMY